MNHTAVFSDSTLRYSTANKSVKIDSHNEVVYLVARAYQNIYGMSLPDDLPYQQTLINAATQLRHDPRAARMDDRALLHAFEDIIRISDEHHAQAQKHHSRASNPVYLRETALDNALEHQKYLKALHEIMPENRISTGLAYDAGRLERSKRIAPSLPNAMDTICQQLAFTLSVK